MENKVLFGFSDLYIGTYTVAADGTVTMGTPYHQAGAVGFSPSSDDSESIFYADNIAYHTTLGNGSYEGDLEVAMFDDEFKTQFLGYVTLADGGLAEVKNASKSPVYVAFAVQGDRQERRFIFYNGNLGNISREFATIEETAEPTTETIPVTFNGDAKTGITVVTYEPDDAGYATLFTNPPAPVLPTKGGNDTTEGGGGE